jgi:TRAP-type C4-dicarboxylate transport system permease small subunit
MTWLAAMMLLFAMLTVCVDVSLRFFLNKSVSWVLPLCEYILLYIPFLAASSVLKEDRHIRIDIMLMRLSPIQRKIAKLISSILGFCVLATLTYYGSYVTLDFYERGVLTISYLKIPEFLVVMIIPIGCFFFALQFLRTAYDTYVSLLHGVSGGTKPS